MTSHRPLPDRLLRAAAGTTLALGALALPLAAAVDTDVTGSVALAADVTAPVVTLGSESAEPGGEVPFTATGFPAGATLSVKFDDKTLLKQFPIGEDGSVSGAVTIPADASVGAGHWLRFLAPQTSVRSADLTVTGATPSPTPTPTPTATPTPTPKPSSTTAPAGDPAVELTGGSSVAAGGKVSFRLSGFVKGQDVTVKLDDGDILAQWPDAVGADGTFSGSVTVPAGTSAGAHWLRFLAPEPATSLKADIKVTSSSGSPGGGSGSGSGAGSGAGSGSGSGDSGSGSAGSGSGTAAGTGGSGSTAGASARITAGSSVAAGGRVSFRVTGFPAGRQLTVKLDDSKIIGQWTVGADGSCSGSVTVPADTPKGAHWLRFLAPNPPTSLKAGFTVTSGTAAAAASGTGASAGGSATPVPAASGAPASATDDRGAKAEITASEVRPGGRLHFEVTKFPAEETVTVKLDDGAILGQWETDEDGRYEGDVTVPADTAVGAHWLRFLAPNPPTSLKVGFTVTGAGQAASSTATPQDPTAKTLAAASVETPVSYATIAWSAAAAAVGGAAGAAATTFVVVRRRSPGSPSAG
ncbi:hypothetical protein ACWDV7_37920 [Streptomyces sp. NPDC003362]